MRLRHIGLIVAMVVLVFGLSVCSDEGGKGSLTDDERWQEYVEPTTPPSGAAKYTIMTFNVDGFDRGWTPDKDASRPARVPQYSWVANIIKTNAVKVLGLIEILDGMATIPSLNNKETHDLDDFNTALTAASYPMAYRGVYPVGAGDGANNIAYCSTVPVSDASTVRSYPDSSTVNFTRSIYKYKVTFPGDNVVWFYSAHLKALNDGQVQRQKEAKMLANYIRANHDLKNDYIVVYGDMNTVHKDDWPKGVLPNALVATNNPSGSASDCTVAWLEFRTGDDTDEFFTSLTRKYIYPNPTFLQGFSQYAMTNGLPLDHIILSPALYKNHYVPGSIKAIGTNTVQVGNDTVSASVQGNRNPSDHVPVLCQLYF